MNFGARKSQYWRTIIGIIAVNSIGAFILPLLMHPLVAWAILGLPSLLLWVLVVSNRLEDAGKAPWLGFLTLIPLASIPAVIYIGIASKKRYDA